MTKQMIEVKTAELEGVALDWAVAKVEGDKRIQTTRKQFGLHVPVKAVPSYSTNWNQCGPLIAKYHVSLSGPGCMGGPADSLWSAYIDTGSFAGGRSWAGPTPLIAACRAIVASKLGDTLSIPRELLP